MKPRFSQPGFSKKGHLYIGRSRQRLKSLCLFSILGAVVFVAKMAMAGLPNIEPVSLSVILLAQVFGWPALAAVYVYIACEWLVWGIGLWSFSYLYVWLILFAITRAFDWLHSALFWALVGAGFGFCFGALCALWLLVLQGWSAAFVWWQNGVFFDLLHGAGNFVVIFLLYKPLYTLLMRLKTAYGIGVHPIQ